MRETPRLNEFQRQLDLLQIPTHIPIMEITRIGYSAKTDRPVEVTVVRIPGDRVEFVSNVQRDESAAWPAETQPTDG